MDWGEIGLQLAQLLLPIIAALIAALIGVVISYLKRQADKIDHELVQESLEAALDEMSRVAYEAITSTAQTYVDDLKASREDGKLTDEEKKEAMFKAKNYFYGHISKGTLEILEASIGPVQNWLDEYLEVHVGTEKKFGGGASG
jgi:hypothetical protein